jgi:hypothetical protein
MHRGLDGSTSSGKNSGNSKLSLALFAAPCSHARVKPGPSQTNCQVSDSGCVVTVRDTGVASLAPRTRFRETTAAAELSKSLLRQVIHLAPNCPVTQYLVYHSLLLTPLSIHHH